MKRISFFYVLFTVLAAPVWAEVRPPRPTGLAPDPDALFAPLRADPRELHFALRVAFPLHDVTAAEVAIGHYYGIYRWRCAGKYRGRNIPAF